MAYLPATAAPASSKARQERNLHLAGLSLSPTSVSLLQTSESKELMTLSLKDRSRGAATLEEARDVKEILIRVSCTFEVVDGLYCLDHHYTSRKRYCPAITVRWLAAFYNFFTTKSENSSN